MGLLSNILSRQADYNQPEQVEDVSIDPVKPNLISIKDTRKVDAATGKPVTDTNKLSYDADPSLIKEIIGKSIKYGVDPFTSLAMAHQETGYALPKPNKYFPDPIKAANPFMVSSKDEFPNKQKIGEWMQSNPDANSIDAFMTLYKDKIAKAQKMGKKDEASQIQGWNGYGKIPAGSYGTDKEIDMSADPIYGKRIIDIRDNVVKKNPEIVKMVQEYQKPVQLNTRIL